MRKNIFQKAILLSLIILLLATVLSPVASAARTWHPPGEATPFRDVPRSAWFHDTVAWAYANGVTVGTSPTTFHPNRRVTRVEFAAFLYNIAGNPPPVGTAPNFPDSATTPSWGRQAIAWATSVGVITGFGDGTLRPNAEISREQMVVILFRYINSLALHEPPPSNEMNRHLNLFHDRGAVSTWATTGMRWAAYYGVIGAGGSLNPRGNATRAETVTMLYRVVESFIIGTPTRAAPPASGPGITPRANAFEAEVFRLTNIERTSRGLPPLHWHTGLGQVSHNFSRDMSNRGFFNHICPSGTSPTDRVRAVGIVYTWGAGENIAMGHRTPQDVVRGWMNSPGHRANILREVYTHIGIGFYNYRWTQKFITVEGIDGLINHPITNDMNERAARTAFVLLNYSRELHVAYSRDRLITRLIGHGFTQAQAEYGADNINADWYRQAVRAAQDMLSQEWNDIMSREWLIMSLIDEWHRFTPSQAEYGVDNSGTDWYERAVMAARSIVQLWSATISREVLITQLTAHGFTLYEAEHAATAVGLS